VKNVKRPRAFPKAENRTNDDDQAACLHKAKEGDEKESRPSHKIRR